MIKNIALCGGGFYGYAEVAALKTLEQYKNRFDIKNISAVSVGSIVGSLYAVGYTPDELAEIIFQIDFDSLIKDNMVPYYHLYENYGMYESKKLEEEIERLIRIKTNIKQCTFSQINLNLIIVATNISMQCPIIFSKEYSPNVVISKAVRMSISYPLIMTPTMYDGNLIGDGGVYMNYPITIFNNLEETIGITFSAYNEHEDGSLKTKMEINDVYDYIKSLGLTMSRAAYKSQITAKHLERSFIVKINEKIGSMQFNLSEDQKKYIYQCGVIAVLNQAGKIFSEN